MRPPEFTGGNILRQCAQQTAQRRFNEAAGIHRRKHSGPGEGPGTDQLASMRPPEFTGGNDNRNGDFVTKVDLLQ